MPKKVRGLAVVVDLAELCHPSETNVLYKMWNLCGYRLWRRCTKKTGEQIWSVQIWRTRLGLLSILSLKNSKTILTVLKSNCEWNGWFCNYRDFFKTERCSEKRFGFNQRNESTTSNTQCAIFRFFWYGEDFAKIEVFFCGIPFCKRDCFSGWQAFLRTQNI